MLFSFQEKPAGFVISMNLHLQYFYARSNLTQLFLSPHDLASGLDTILVTMRSFYEGLPLIACPSVNELLLKPGI